MSSRVDKTPGRYTNVLLTRVTFVFLKAVDYIDNTLVYLQTYYENDTHTVCQRSLSHIYIVNRFHGTTIKSNNVPWSRYKKMDMASWT